MGDNFNLMNNSIFSDHNIFKSFFHFVRSNNHFECESVDAKTNCYNWIYGKCSILDIPNKNLADYLIKLHNGCQDVNSFFDKMDNIISTDNFKSLFADKSSCCGVTFNHKFSLVKYKPIRDYNICPSYEDLFDYMCHLLTQTKCPDLPRIPALIGSQDSGKTYITNRLLPYYLSKHIKGDLYVLTIDCSKVKDGSDIYFKHNPLNYHEVLVGGIAEGIMRSNECNNDDDFFLVILDKYTEMPMSAMAGTLSFLGDFYSPEYIGDNVFERKTNLGIVMNGRRYGKGVFQDIVNDSSLCSRCNIIYESPYANKINGRNKYLESSLYYGILSYKDRTKDYLKSFGDNFKFAINELEHRARIDNTLTIDCREFTKTVYSSITNCNKASAFIDVINDLVKSLPDEMAGKCPDNIKNVEDCILVLNMYLDYDETIYIDNLISKKTDDILLIYVVIILQQLRYIKKTNTWITQYTEMSYVSGSMCGKEVDWERTFSTGSFMLDKYYCTGMVSDISKELYYNIGAVLDMVFDVIIREYEQDNFEEFIKKCKDIYNDIFTEVLSYEWGNPGDIQGIKECVYRYFELKEFCIDNAVLLEATKLLFNSIV